ncbi:DUF4442 domain-containing protein [Neisseria leonii]|uniref:DUF4442 domain-containing protein n=1 Tax=Neisseria leonii TaxID=2995413 RepID=A0A9X4IA24_9NEIS|nr:DUF4442 domain-containing protein [Neisseria sp. 51.81]MDD9326965.1 DUF4442 domain-containing protein [Neisseria sp. 51.81]
MLRRRFRHPRLARLMLNLWPPLLLSGIQVTELSDDFRRMKTRLKNWPGTRNLHGAQFGGNLFALTDAAYAIMLNHMIGDQYYVWDKSAHIDFIRPGRGEVSIECVLTDDMMADIYRHTADGGKYLPEYEVVIKDKAGETVAVARRTLYIRLKPEFRPQKNAPVQ